MSNSINALCPNCNKNIPFIYLIDDKVFVECRCLFREKISLCEYFASLAMKKENSVSTYRNRCKKHSQPIKYYCRGCNLRLCEKEKQSHAHFDIISFDTLNIASIRKSIAHAEDHLNNFFPSLKNKFNTPSINKAYSQCVSRSKLTFKFLHLLTDNYHGDNYEMYRNVSSNNAINVYFPIESDNIDCVHRYFSYYSFTALRPSFAEQCRNIISLLLLKDNRVACCTSAHSIKIYSPLRQWECDEILIEHSRIVSICQIDSGELVSCSEGKTIKIWDVNKSECVFTIKTQFEYESIAAIDDNNFIAASSKEKKMKIWTGSAPHSEIKEIPIESSNEYQLLYIKEKSNLLLVTLHSIRVWSMRTYQCVYVIQGVGCWYINALYQIDSEKIVIGNSHTLYVIDIANGRIEDKVINERVDFCSFTLIRNRTTLLCGGYGKFYLYDMRRREGNEIKIAGNDCVIDLVQSNDNIVIAAVSDDTLQVWECF